MPTHITQVDDQQMNRSILQVEGSLTLADAELLEKISIELLRERTGHKVMIDLADLSFLDSEGATVLNRLKQQGVTLEGVHHFIQKVIELAERLGVESRNI